MKKIDALPSMLTLGNLLCGFYAVRVAAKGLTPEVAAADASLLTAAWLILFAMVFDALDGKVARWTGAAGRFGAELDSLADVVSFGVAPAFLVAQVAQWADSQHQRLVWLCCCVYVLCAALRLARFNVETTPDESSHRHFRGLPSPAAAGQVVSLVILHLYLKQTYGFLLIGRLLPATAFFAGILMVSHVRYPHVVSRFLSGRRAFTEVVFVAIVALLLVAHKEFTLAAGFTIFTVAGGLGVAHKLVFQRDKEEDEEEEEEPVF